MKFHESSSHEKFKNQFVKCGDKRLKYLNEGVITNYVAISLLLQAFAGNTSVMHQDLNCKAIHGTRTLEIQQSAIC